MNQKELLYLYFGFKKKKNKIGGMGGGVLSSCAPSQPSSIKES